MSIALSGRDNKGKPWTLAMEFRYSNPETLYAKPVREALKRLSSLDITRSEEEIILYVEGDSDFSILHAWAKVLDGTGVKKKEYYQIAEQMKPEEMHDDVREMLDTLVNHFGI